MPNTLPPLWSTTELLLTDLHQDDIETAQTLYEKSAFMEEWTGQPLDHDYVIRCLHEGDLPPNGHKDQFKIQAVRKCTTGKIIGLLVLYHGHPNSLCVYITFLFFDPEVQRHGLGRELVRELLLRLKRLGYEEVRANVQLKNWAGLRFWTNVGLTTITGVYGDPTYSTKAHADIELSRRL